MRKALLLSLLAACLAAGARSQTPEDSPQDVSPAAEIQAAATFQPTPAIAAESAEVVVTGSRIQGTRGQLPQRVEIIGSDALRSSGSNDLADLLKRNSELEIQQYTGGLSGIGLRGFKPDVFSGVYQHTQVLVDGLPTGTNSISLLDPRQIERVEILKGPASAEYGAGAMGGVVNLVTTQSREGVTGSFAAALGSFDSWQACLNAGGKMSQGLDFDLGISSVGQEGLTVAGEGRHQPASPYRRLNLDGRLGFQLLPWARLQAKGSLENGRFGFMNTDYFTLVQSPAYKDSILRKAQLILDAQGDWQEFELLGFAEEEDVTVNYLAVVPSPAPLDLQYVPSTISSDYIYYKDQASFTRWYGGLAKETLKFGSQRLALGVDYKQIFETSQKWTAPTNAPLYDNTQRTAPWNADSESDHLGAFAEGRLSLWEDRIIGTLGGRYDSIRLKLVDTPYLTGVTWGESPFSAFSPSAGLKIKPVDPLCLHYTIGQGFMTPKPSQLAGQSVAWGTTYLSNPDLKAETSQTWDAGVTLEHKPLGFYLDVTYFETMVRDKIIQVKQDPVTFNYKNALGAHMQGIEAEFSEKVPVAGTGYARLFLGATDLTRAREEYFDASGNKADRDIENIADLRCHYGLEFFYGFVKLRGTARYVGTILDEDFSAGPAQRVAHPVVTVVDLAEDITLGQGHTISLIINNVGDKYYSEITGYPMPGANYMVRYAYQF